MPDYQHRGSPLTTPESRTVWRVPSKAEKAPCVRGTDVLMDTMRWRHHLTFELEGVCTQHCVTGSSEKASEVYFSFSHSRRLSLYLCISSKKIAANLRRLVFWMATKSSTVQLVFVWGTFKKKKMNARKQVLHTKLVCCNLCIINEDFENQILTFTSKQCIRSQLKIFTPPKKYCRNSICKLQPHLSHSTLPVAVLDLIDTFPHFMAYKKQGV